MKLFGLQPAGSGPEPDRLAGGLSASGLRESPIETCIAGVTACRWTEARPAARLADRAASVWQESVPPANS